MIMIELGRELRKAQHRILDHRVFVNGEIDTFLNNFEVKRNDSEVLTLFQVTESIGALKYDLSERCVSLGTQHLNDISSEIHQLLGGVNELLIKVNQPRQLSAQLLQVQKERLKRRSNFENDLQHSYQRIEASFEEKEEEISELYSDLELKLNIPKN